LVFYKSGKILFLVFNQHIALLFAQFPGLPFLLAGERLSNHRPSSNAQACGAQVASEVSAGARSWALAKAAEVSLYYP
jgi:hypothetical protein